MMRKKRGYKRDTPVRLMRDYRLFAIACEGGKREPEYFNLFQYMSGRIKVDIIEDIISDAEMERQYKNKSAPKWVLERATKYIDKEGLLDEDFLWFVVDKDHWSEKQLREIAKYCEDYPNWHIVISNPCFEVWLYFHKRVDISKSASTKCADFKKEISTFEKGGYHPHKFISDLLKAIANAKKADSDPNHFLPKVKETKVYQLGETLLEFIEKKGFDDFIQKKLPQLIKDAIVRGKDSKRKRH